MRLHDFISANVEPILTEWVAFARTRSGADGMNLVALRDHATDMLRQIVEDLATPQTPREQFEKSQGPVEPDDDAATRHAEPAGEDSAAETHGAGRAISGFTVGEMVAEFRALRASVLRLWLGARPSLDGAQLDDMMRFNEAIDQAVAESVSRFTRDMDRSRDMFIGILSHDLRTPLQTVLLTTEQLLDGGATDVQQVEALQRAHRSASRMNGMIDDLLDFTRSRMGSGLAITVGDVDVGDVVRESVEEVSVTRPGCRFDLRIEPELTGGYDGNRLRQVLVNLLGNAAAHGESGAPIGVTATGSATEIAIAVTNAGPAIEPEDMPGIFGPFKRLRPGAPISSSSRHLGLGLYIADQIVAAHGGRIEVASTTADGTCFTAYLPR